jgi:GNAT superfamily N-acetyltransferase
MVTLRPIDDDNREQVLALAVAPHQDRFVSGVADSLQEAADEPGGRARPFALCDGDLPVGFVMLSHDVADETVYYPNYLWKLLVDERYQGRGYGRAALDLVTSWFRERGVSSMLTSAGQGEGSPIGFYERYGFVRTGDVVFDDEVKLRLEL